MKKRVFTIYLFVIMTLTLFACGHGNTPEVDFDAVSATFKDMNFLVLGPSTPYRQIAFHAHTNCGCADMPRCACGDNEEIWVFLHESRSAANTAWDAARFLSGGRIFDGIQMTAYREGRLVFYGTPEALAIFERARNGG